MCAIKRLCIAIFLISNCSFSYAQFEKNDALNLKFISNAFNRNVDISDRTTKHSKAVAVGLTLSLGLFGVHRMYLGTTPKVPVIYTFTLAGGGIIFLGDLGTLLFTKDLDKYNDLPDVIMWGSKD